MDATLIIFCQAQEVKEVMDVVASREYYGYVKEAYYNVHKQSGMQAVNTGLFTWWSHLKGTFFQKRTCNWTIWLGDLTHRLSLKKRELLVQVSTRNSMVKVHLLSWSLSENLQESVTLVKYHHVMMCDVIALRLTWYQATSCFLFQREYFSKE